jgi:hypothetical protein
LIVSALGHRRLPFAIQARPSVGDIVHFLYHASSVFELAARRSPAYLKSKNGTNARLRTARAQLELEKRMKGENDDTVVNE